MFTNYSSLGCRSRSTTDIFRAQSLEDRSHPPMTYGITWTRSTSFVTTAGSSNVNRRPAPPRRSDSFAGVVPSALKRAEEEETRRLLGTSTPVEQVERQAAQTPRSTFVRKLVASLERRQKEMNGAYGKAEKNLEPVEEREEEKIVKRPVVMNYAYNRLPSRELEDLQEREHEEEEEDSSSSSLSDDFSELGGEAPPARKLWSNSRDPVNVTNDVSLDPDPARSSFKRSLKNMLSSILNWRTGSAKNLPKGTRDYYAARESLGDEMGTFRKLTVPRLIERATSRGRLDRSRGETSRKNLQEFSNFIGEPKQALDERLPSIATIHPVYGNLKRSTSRIRVIEPAEARQLGYGSLKVQLPAVPIRYSSLPTEHQLSQLPSMLRDLQKLKRPSVVYDVPRSGRRLMALESQFSPPEYENFKRDPSRDKRNRSSIFKKF